MILRRRGFTLVELMIVMVIIGILITFILKAYVGGVRVAEEKATIALIAKLESAMADRLDGLNGFRPTPTQAHNDLASMYSTLARDLNTGLITPIVSVQRAQVIAQYDYLRAQLPDVFAVQSTASATAGVYPLNFAATAWRYTDYRGYMLPLGAFDENKPVEGMYGASFEIASGLYKQLGYNPAGYDGNDNDQNGTIDDSKEGLDGLSADEIATINTRLARHTHKTARAEMLYAILVEGAGPYGSAFNKDDFTSKEVQDTDGDGLMEFVDAWGEPLQFYRWPILYRSDAQKGYPDTLKLTSDAGLGSAVKPGPYTATLTGGIAVSYEQREQNPLDPNQTLVAPAWWGSAYNNALPAGIGTNSGAVSGQALTFMTHFGPCLVDPIAVNSGAPSQTFWDRSTSASTGYYLRRAYYSRFLILSGGPDKMPGTARLTDPKDKIPVIYATLDDRSTIETPTAGVVNGPGSAFGASARDASGGAVGLTVPSLLIESQGGKVDPNRGALGSLTTFGVGGRNDTNTLLEYYSQDDITSHGLQSTGGPLK